MTDDEEQTRGELAGRAWALTKASDIQLEQLSLLPAYDPRFYMAINTVIAKHHPADATSHAFADGFALGTMEEILRRTESALRDARDDNSREAHVFDQRLAEMKERGLTEDDLDQLYSEVEDDIAKLKKPLLKVYRLRFEVDLSGIAGHQIAPEWIVNYESSDEARQSNPRELNEQDLLRNEMPQRTSDGSPGHSQLVMLDCTDVPQIVAVEQMGEWEWLSNSEHD